MFWYSMIFLVVFATLNVRVAPASKAMTALREFSDPFTIDDTDPAEVGRKRMKYFRLSFYVQRQDQMRLIHNFTAGIDGEAQYQVLFGVIAVMQHALTRVASYGPDLDRANYKFEVEEMGQVLANRTVKLALADTLMNVALLGHILIRFPNETMPLLSSKNWKTTIYWGLKLANETRFLLDSVTRFMFDMLHRELNVTREDLDAEKPYWYLDFPAAKTQFPVKKRRRKTLRYDL